MTFRSSDCVFCCCNIACPAKCFPRILGAKISVACSRHPSFTRARHYSEYWVHESLAHWTVYVSLHDTRSRMMGTRRWKNLYVQPSVKDRRRDVHKKICRRRYRCRACIASRVKNDGFITNDWQDHCTRNAATATSHGSSVFALRIMCLRLQLFVRLFVDPRIVHVRS